MKDNKKPRRAELGKEGEGAKDGPNVKHTTQYSIWKGVGFMETRNPNLVGFDPVKFITVLAELVGRAKGLQVKVTVTKKHDVKKEGRAG